MVAMVPPLTVPMARFSFAKHCLSQRSLARTKRPRPVIRQSDDRPDGPRELRTRREGARVSAFIEEGCRKHAVSRR